jgi:hypothetical protein
MIRRFGLAIVLGFALASCRTSDSAVEIVW